MGERVSWHLGDSAYFLGALSALRADAGISPRRATFLFEQPKRKAKKLPLMPASLRFVALRFGQPAVLGHGVCGETHCALRAPFKQTPQASSRSAAVLRQPHHPTPCAPQRWQKGVDNRTSNGLRALPLLSRSNVHFKSFRPLAYVLCAPPAINLIEILVTPSSILTNHCSNAHSMF